MTTATAVEWTAIDRPCPVCQSREVRALGARGGRAHHGRKGVTTTIVECRGCELQYASPTLLPAGNPYASHSVDDYFRGNDDEGSASRGAHYASFAEQVLGGPGRVLELGCGRGGFLVGARRRGWRVAGVEMTEGFAQAARERGIEIEVAPILESSLLDREYDLVLMLNILEHLYDPLETLSRVRSALRPGGLVAIGVPNERSLTNSVANAYMRLQGRDWCVNLSPTFEPFHVVGFTPKSLTLALHKSGFAIHRLEVVRGSNDSDAGTGPWSKRLERAALNLSQRVGGAVGRGDAIDCWAVRE